MSRFTHSSPFSRSCEADSREVQKMRPRNAASTAPGPQHQANGDGSMRDESIRRNPPVIQDNLLILFNKRRADDAFAAHAALVRMEAENPSLAENPAWQALRADAFENFTLAFEVAQ